MLNKIRNKTWLMVFGYISIANALLDTYSIRNITDTSGDCEMFVSDLLSNSNFPKC